VFKVACDGIRGISKGSSCDWNDKCTDPTKNETAQGCPFDNKAQEAFQRCSAMPGYPKPGLFTDRIFCEDLQTRGRMVHHTLNLFLLLSVNYQLRLCCCYLRLFT
jgi:hypothetical protein